MPATCILTLCKQEKPELRAKEDVKKRSFCHQFRFCLHYQLHPEWWELFSYIDCPDYALLQAVAFSHTLDMNRQIDIFILA